MQGLYPSRRSVVSRLTCREKMRRTNQKMQHPRQGQIAREVLSSAGPQIVNPPRQAIPPATLIDLDPMANRMSRGWSNCRVSSTDKVPGYNQHREHPLTPAVGLCGSGNRSHTAGGEWQHLRFRKQGRLARRSVPKSSDTEDVIFSESGSGTAATERQG